MLVKTNSYTTKFIRSIMLKANWRPRMNTHYFRFVTASHVYNYTCLILLTCLSGFMFQHMVYISCCNIVHNFNS